MQFLDAHILAEHMLTQGQEKAATNRGKNMVQLLAVRVKPI